MCHLSSRIFLETHKYAEWEKMLDESGESLAHIHLDKEIKKVMSKERIIRNSHDYFKSEKYASTYKILRAFILEATKEKELGGR